MKTLGLLVLLMSLALSDAAAQTTLFARNSVWRYRDTATALPGSWNQPGYDDSAWPAGPGGLGYGDPCIATPVPFGPSSSARWITTHFRISFTLPVAPATLTSLTFEANYDDGFVAYLNGVEVARRSMPAGPVSYGTLALNHEGGTYETIDLTSSTGALVQGANVLAIEVHQRSADSSDLAWDGSLSYATSAFVTRGPYLQRGGPDRVTVRWRTNVATNSRVRYGPWPAPPVLDADLAASTTEHEITLTGLAPDTHYGYSVGSTTAVLAGGDATTTFTTAPLPGTAKPIRIWAIGDAGTAIQPQLDVRDAYEEYTSGRPTDLWLMLGDNAYETGTDAEYQAAVFDVYGSMLRQSVLFPTRGNHDVLAAGANNDYYDIFTMPTSGESGGLPSGSEAYYSYDWANVHFVCLDSEGSDRSVSGDMIRWLRDDLAATSRDWVIAYWHHPPYTKGSHDSDDPLDSGGRMRDMRQNVLPVLDSAGVDLVLTGHSHSYERSYLIDGHYGVSSTLVPSMIVDPGAGRVDGDGAYHKATLGTGPGEGAVYAVAGSSGHIEAGGTLNHPAMRVSLLELGSMVIDVDGSRLDARFLDDHGAVRDSFTIEKGAQVSVPPIVARGPLVLLPTSPNPFTASTRVAFELARPTHASVTVLDLFGRRVRTLARGPRAAGRHELQWDGRDDLGRRLPAGSYF